MMKFDDSILIQSVFRNQWLEICSKIKIEI